MNTQRTHLGTCPLCGSAIRTQHVLIEYETNTGRSVWAECPACADVVDPE